MARHVTKPGRDSLKAEEGAVRRTYLDIKGIPTKGVGHTNAAGPPHIKLGDAPWSDEMIDRVFTADLAKYEADVDAVLRTDAPPFAFDGSTSFHYNTGAIKRATWVRLYNGGNPLWRERIMDWCKPEALRARRKRERDMIDWGTYRVVGVLDKLSAPGRRDEVQALQKDLGLLGFYHDDINGVWNSATENAVRRFQSTHPHLTVDGRVGPATRAQIARAKALLVAGGAGAGGLAGTGGGIVGGVPLPVIGIFALIVIGLLVWAGVRYWPEIQQRWFKWRGTYVS